MMKVINKYAIYGLIGASLGSGNYFAFRDWQWWAWYSAMMLAMIAHDIAMSKEK